MGFHNVRFPVSIDYSSAGGPGFNTAIIELASGAEETVQRWGAPKRRYNARYTIRSLADLYAAVEFYIARGGPANTFRYKDWLDFTSASDGRSAPAEDDVLVASGDGSTTEFQLIKKYTSGNVQASRTIALPVAGTVLIAVDGVSQSEGSDFTVSDTTGLVTFATAPGNNLEITAGFEFDVKVRFGEEVDFSFVASIDTFDSGAIPDIPLVENRELTADPELAWNGGSKDFGITSIATTISLADGAALRFSPSSSHDVIFPDQIDIEAGGPIFAIFNKGGAATLTLKYSDASTTIGTVAAGASAELWLVENATSGLKEWQLK